MTSESLPYDAVALRERLTALREPTEALIDIGTDLGCCRECAAIAWRLQIDHILQALTPMKGGETPQETWESIAAWQRETFGPVELGRQAKRAAEEMDELLADPTDVREAADVCIVLAGYPGIREAINRKMAINRARKWKLNGDGSGYHVKSAAPTTPAGKVGDQ